MSDRYRSLADLQAIEAEAARRFLRASDSDTPEDWEDAYRWVEQDPAHGVAFAKAEASWELAGRLPAGPHATENRAENKDGNQIAAALSWPAPQASLAGNMVHRRQAIAAGLAAVVIGSAGLFALTRPAAAERYTTSIGEKRPVRLADGSVIHLNTQTDVEVRFEKTRRLVRLVSGEARFDVAHDKSRPFIVTAGSAILRAVGTAFNVRLRPDLTELTVIEGTVAAADAGGQRARAIAAGTGAAIRSGTVAVTELAPQLVRQRIAWEDGVIEFDGDTLGQAVDEFNRYRTTPLVIGEPRLASIRIGGTFRSGNSDAFLLALEQSFGIRAIPGQDNSVMLVPAQ